VKKPPLSIVPIVLAGTLLSGGVPGFSKQAAALQASVEIHYAPAENLETIDTALIDSAQHEIDLAGYVLTDWKLIEALTRAADRGVTINIYLDGGMTGEDPPSQPLKDLAVTPDVGIKIKPKGTPLMHLKSFEIDGELLRTGSANFSASGEKRQDNDLVIVRSPAAAAAFKRSFEIIWMQGEALR
jgi:phosphatidylserine/phosphatidylglycerophosphate/cardiolipin synthase-like enzyme